MMDVMMWCVYLLLAVLSLTSAAPAGDKIDSLPGLLKQPSFNMYSGYLEATGNKHFFYWFFESHHKPASDPLVLWLNGGPGCSSVLQAFINGPFTIVDNGTLDYSSYSWNTKANLLYIDSPAGVGFSFSDDKKYATDDVQVALDNLAALESFFTKFPEFKINEFFLFGISYAGIYLPTLAVNIVNKAEYINLKGVGIGNPLLNWADMDNERVIFTYYHGLIDEGVWSKLTSYCCVDDKCNFYNNTDPKCITLVNSTLSTLSDMCFNWYNVYSDCNNCTLHNNYLHRPNTHSLQTISRSCSPLPTTLVTDMTTYLNNPIVRKALHTNDSVSSWSSCSETVLTNYKFIYKDMAPFVTKLLIDNAYRFVMYSGDVDMVVPSAATEKFVDDLDVELQVMRRPWLYNDGFDQIAGFVKEYKNIAFLSVKGAGHLAAYDKSEAVYTMFNNFIYRNPY